MQQLALNQSSYVQGNKRPALRDALKAAYRSGDADAIAEAEYQYDLYSWECHPAGPKPTRSGYPTFNLHAGTRRRMLVQRSGTV